MRVEYASSNHSLRENNVYGRMTTVGSFAAIKIKTAQQFKIAGKPTPRIDVPAKVDGSAIFGIDMRLPGMLYAAVAYCPVFGGKVRRYDFAAIKGMPGVRSAVDIGSGVAVVANSYWQAAQAVKALPIEWDQGAGAGSSSEQ